MVGDQIDCIEDWLHSGNISDMGKKSRDGAGNSKRYADIGSLAAQGTGTGKSGIKACQRNIA
ncbi:MAG: hypothetical protein K2Q45_09415 [Nitrosomonas sp.]|nr:hypothetical protein [Nitrosomonas sp.]